MWERMGMSGRWLNWWLCECNHLANLQSATFPLHGMPHWYWAYLDLAKPAKDEHSYPWQDQWQPHRASCGLCRTACSSSLPHCHGTPAHQKSKASRPHYKHSYTHPHSHTHTHCKLGHQTGLSCCQENKPQSVSTSTNATNIGKIHLTKPVILHTFHTFVTILIEYGDLEVRSDQFILPMQLFEQMWSWISSICTPF